MATTEDAPRESSSHIGKLVRTVSLAVLVLLLSLIVVGYAFRWSWTGFPGTTLFEWLKILVFPAAVAIGTFLLNRAVKAREEARDQAKARNEDRKAVLARVTSSYNETKKVRRILKAHIVTDEETGEKGIPCAVYETQLTNLMEPQLQFELYKKPSRGQPLNAFLRSFRDPGDMAERLGGLEAYLHGVIQEYDGGKYQRRKVQPAVDGTCMVLLKDFRKLDEFITKSAFINEFSSKFRRVTAQMQKEILDL